MRRLHRHLFRAIVSLFLAISIMYIVWNYPYPRPTAIFFNELRGYTSIDFAACLPIDQEVGVQYGYQTYRLDQVFPGLCRMRSASVVEMPEWDGQYTYTCLVPRSFGTQTFAVRGWGIDYGWINAYCLSSTDIIPLVAVMLILGFILFLFLSGVGWLERRYAARRLAL